MTARRPPSVVPAVTITIAGPLRYWVAEALYDQIRSVHDAERLSSDRRRRKMAMMRRSIADDLRDLASAIGVGVVDE